MEKIIETKVCKCGTKFNITDKDLEFYDKVSPAFNGQKYSIPTPTLCPDCRQQRRLSFRNERKLYKRICDLTGKDIISIYSPDKPYKVYEQSEWWSDKWDPMDYGRDFDFGKSFFEQYDNLSKDVPKMSIRITPDFENCHYCHYGISAKGCYMCVNVVNSENCYYSHTPVSSLYDCDGLLNSENQFCYNCVQSTNNYNCNYLLYSHNCSYSYFLKDCVNCHYCVGCENLKDKKYCYFNQQLTEEDYKNKAGKDFLSYSNFLKLREDFEKFSKKQFKPAVSNLQSELCTGDFIVNSNNCKDCFGVVNLKDSKYCWTCGAGSEYLFDCLHVGPTNLCYEGMAIALGNHNAFLLETRNGINTYYLNSSQNCSNCFGCFGLKDAQYCILNKQYTKEEYEILIPRVIESMKTTGEWGEFFPSSISPFGYNETVANEYYPLSKEEAISRGFKWSDYEAPFPKVDKTIPASKLPENIKDIPDDILNWAIECEVSGKPFRIIKQELEFYRKHNLPVPRRHPDVRHMDRMKLRNPRKLYDRKCDKCSKEIKTTYVPERPEIVYCEECYSKDVV